MLLSAALGVLLGAQMSPVREGRFRPVAPLPGLPSVLADTIGDGIGVAQQRARALGLQGRVMWIDATANLERVSSRERIDALFAKLKSVGFNTVVYDVKPIVGYTVYPSALTEQLTEWRGQRLPKGFDPLAAMCAAAKASGLSLLVSLNAFSEGHRFTMTGPGYARPSEQTVQYEPRPFVKAPWPSKAGYIISTPANPPAFQPDALHVFTRAPTNWPPGTAFATIDSGFKVVANSMGEKAAPPAIPEGGSLLAGGGLASQFLAENTRPGSRLRFDSVAEFAPISQNQTQWPLMMNPHLPAVRERALAFVREVVGKYAVDGVLFDDRLRYGGLDADFSDEARRQFEAYVGRPVDWPGDIYTATFSPTLKRGVRPGPLWDAWLEWRARTLQSFVEDTRRAIKATRPGVLLGVYAGSWLGDYARYGSNYSSPSFLGGFSYMTQRYRRTGYAPSLDLLMTGAYYDVATIADAMAAAKPPGRTVEAAAQLSNRAARDQAWVYAGINLSQLRGDPRLLADCLQAATAASQGVMVFDLSHDIDKLWPVFEAAFKRPARAPHQIRGLLEKVRYTRRSLDAMRASDPPPFLWEGSPGAGE